MIQSVMNSGFKALSGWLLAFSAVVLLFFIVASVVNAISGTSRFNTGEIMKLLTTEKERKIKMEQLHRALCHSGLFPGVSHEVRE